MIHTAQDLLRSSLSAKNNCLISEFSRHSVPLPQVQEVFFSEYRSHQQHYDLLVSAVVQDNSSLSAAVKSFSELCSQMHIDCSRFSEICPANPQIKEIAILGIFPVSFSLKDLISSLTLGSRCKSKQYFGKKKIIKFGEDHNNNLNPQIRKEDKEERDVTQTKGHGEPEMRGTKMGSLLQKKCSFQKKEKPILTNYQAMRDKIDGENAKKEIVKCENRDQRTSTPGSPKKMTIEFDEQVYERHSFAQLMEIECSKPPCPAAQAPPSSDLDSEEEIFQKMEEVKPPKAKQMPHSQVPPKQSKPVAQPRQAASQPSLQQTGLLSWFAKSRGN